MQNNINRIGLVGIVYPDKQSATTNTPLRACAQRGSRLKTAMFSLGENSQKAIALEFKLNEKGLRRWFSGGGMSHETALELAAILIDRKGVDEARRVFLGDNTGKPDTDTANTNELSHLQASLLRAYRWLPDDIKLGFAKRVLSVVTLKTDTSGHHFQQLDTAPLDDIEQAMAAHLANIMPVSKAVLLVAELVEEAQSFKH